MIPEGDHARSQEGLLTDGDRPAQSSLGDDDSSDSGLDIEELELLEAEPTSPRLRGGWSPTKKKSTRPLKGHPRLPSKRKGGLLRSKTCLLIGAIIGGMIVGLVGGFFEGIFKRPGLRDGVSLVKSAARLLAHVVRSSSLHPGINHQKAERLHRGKKVTRKQLAWCQT